MDKQDDRFAQRLLDSVHQSGYEKGVKEVAEKIKYFCADGVIFDDWSQECKLIQYIDELVEELVNKS